MDATASKPSKFWAYVAVVGIIIEASVSDGIAVTVSVSPASIIGIYSCDGNVFVNGLIADSSKDRRTI